jgi:hypothetical protein
MGVLWYKSIELPETATILSVGAGAIALLVSIVEFETSLIIGVELGFAVSVVSRLVMRMFDRGFLLRRVFLTWITLGVGVLSLVPISAAFQIPSLSIDFGSPPTLIVGGIWCVGLIVLALLAFWEARDSSRQ